MRSLNTSLVSGSPRVAALLALLLGLVTAGPLSSLFGAVPGAWLWGLLLGASIWLGLLWVVSAAVLPRVHADVVGRRLRVRGRDYPVTALRSATRSVSANATANYLIYRFTLDDGHRFRVLAEGRPFHGLSAEGLTTLRALIDASSIVEPEGFSPEQQRISSTLQRNQRATPVGRLAMLQDLDDLLGVAPAHREQTSMTEPSLASAASPPVDPEALLVEDSEAAENIRQRYGTLLRLRRISVIIAIVGAALFSLLVASFALDGWIDIPGWSTEHPAVEPVGIVAVMLGIIGVLAWAMLADAAVRRVRRLADVWWEAADPVAREHELPTPYLVIDATGANRGTTIVAFTSTVFGAIGTVITIVASFDEDIRDLLLGALVTSAILVTLSIICWRRSRRDVRERAERVALRARLRLSAGT